MLTIRTKLGNFYYHKGELYDPIGLVVCPIDYEDVPTLRKIQSIEDLVNFNIAESVIWDTNPQDLYENYLDIINWDEHLSEDEIMSYESFMTWVNQTNQFYFVINYADIW